MRDTGVEILFLSETWLTDAISDSLLDMPGYNLHRLDRDITLGKNRGGGIVAYVKEGIKATMLTDRCVSTPGIEMMVLKMSLEYTKPIYIVCVYRPPDQVVSTFIDALDNMINTLYARANFELNVIGDTNINVLKRTMTRRNIMNS